MARGRPLPREQQVAIFRRDRWICCWCDRPVIFAPALKYLELDLHERSKYKGKLAYFHPNLTRRNAPLLDALAAVLDHVEAAKLGGATDAKNLVTSCNKCNMKKNALPLEKWKQLYPAPKPIRSTYGEPEDWDGFSSLFIVLSDQYSDKFTSAEKDWLKALKQS